MTSTRGQGSQGLYLNQGPDLLTELANRARVATVGRYVSLEQLIAESADDYYQALLDATHDWNDHANDPWP